MTTTDERQESSELLPELEPAQARPEPRIQSEEEISDIAAITARAVENCERAAGSLEEIAAAGDRLNAALRSTCTDGARMFRERGHAQVKLVTDFAQYVEEQCTTVRRLLDQADIASPPPAPPTQPTSTPRIPKNVSVFAPKR